MFIKYCRNLTRIVFFNEACICPIMVQSIYAICIHIPNQLFVTLYSNEHKACITCLISVFFKTGFAPTLLLNVFFPAIQMSDTFCLSQSCLIGKNKIPLSIHPLTRNCFFFPQAPTVSQISDNWLFSSWLLFFNVTFVNHIYNVIYSLKWVTV